MNPHQCHCADGWICESHPDQAWPHAQCAGRGMLCDCPIGQALKERLDAKRAADPFVSLHCPYCPRELAYERTEGETRFYRCSRCGPLALPPDGRIRRVLPKSETHH
jgi:hypothetical protein